MALRLYHVAQRSGLEPFSFGTWPRARALPIIQGVRRERAAGGASEAVGHVLDGADSSILDILLLYPGDQQQPLSTAVRSVSSTLAAEKGRRRPLLRIPVQSCHIQ
jgi:hypothetical protein